ncbi:MAG TPA: FmdB family zinc ribbon protein [Burkholderiales bacterium]|nr:FmdB family zinc ribbon protein [Burkholderiales bacterium]
MPIYEYRCAACGFQDEFLQKVSERPLKVCPSCGKAKFEKMLSAPGFQLKGSGWYATDFKGGAKPAAEKADAAGEAKSEAKAEPKADSKTEAKAEPAKPAKANKAPATTTN